MNNESFLLIVASLLFIAVGTFILLNNIKKLKEWEKTKATVVDYVKSRSEGQIMYSEVVSFIANGKKIEAVNRSDQVSSPFKINEKIDIVYNPLNNNKIMIISLFRVYIFPMIFILLGLLSLFITLKNI